MFTVLMVLVVLTLVFTGVTTLLRGTYAENAFSAIATIVGMVTVGVGLVYAI